MVKIGNAPVSYGAFEVTVGKHEGVPSAAEVLDAVQAAGYEGIDLGPVGYLGLGEDLRTALSSRGLLLTGGYVEIDVSSDTPDADVELRSRSDACSYCVHSRARSIESAASASACDSSAWAGW